MTADGLAEAVREQVGLGRVLPLGGTADRTWMTERCAGEALRAAAAGLDGLRLGTLRIGPAEPGRAAVAGAPPGAVPYGPLRIAAGFEAASDRPLPGTAERLRRVLWGVAHDGLGLPVSAVDLEITGLLDETAEAGAPPPAAPAEGTGRWSSGAEAVAGAVLAVPGVAGVTARLGGFGPGVQVSEAEGPPGGLRVQAQIAVAAGHRALDVARAVAAAATTAAIGPATTTVVVTDTAGP